MGLSAHARSRAADNVIGASVLKIQWNSLASTDHRASIINTNRLCSQMYMPV